MLETTLAATRSGLQWGDWTALVVYMAVMMGVGVWYSRGERSTEAYLLGGRSIAWWAVGLSFIVSISSTLSLVGGPGEVYNHGMTMSLGMLIGPFATIGAFCLFVRFFFKRRMFTPFEYLEQRFDNRIRTIAAALFWLTRLSYLALVLYSSSKIFQGAAGWNVHWTVLAVGTIGIAYTVLGGIRAVVWTDVLQFLVIVVGLGVMAVIVIGAVPGGVGGILKTTFDKGHGFPGVDSPSFWKFGKDMLYERYILWFIILNPISQSLFYHSADQISVQRLLSTSSYKQAKRAMFTNVILSFPMTLVLLFIGMAVFSFYHRPGVALAPENGDLALFQFIANHMPAPLAGLLLAAMLAAVMSTVDSGINSLATVVTKDFYLRLFRRDASERGQVRFAGAMTILIGIFAVVAAMVLASISESFKESIVEASWVWMAMNSVLPGIFLMAVLSRRATARHALIATVCGWAAAVTLMVLYFVSKSQNPDKPLSMMLIGLGGLVVTCSVGLVITRFSPRRPATELEDKTIWTLRSEQAEPGVSSS